MVERDVEAHLRAVAKRYPVVVVLGPRQSGKTTLCRRVFAGKPYVSLEDPDTREFARSDPRGFLARYPGGAVLDEVQRVPELPSYLQTLVDAQRKRGLFILTGSENLALSERVSQSLAGRAALVTLLPLTLAEARRFPRAGRAPRATSDLLHTLFTGGYPAIYDRKQPPSEWLGNYVRTYVERDVRQVLNVTDLVSFQTFLGLCAGHAGQLLNLSALGAAAGITHNTAKAWLSVLEASYLVHRVPPWVGNVNKRLVKTPKLHFYDSGLLCYLLGIRDADALATHANRGAIFESWVVSEVVKANANYGLTPRVSFFRDHKGMEVDLVIETGKVLLGVEIKSGKTVATDFFSALNAVRTLVAPRLLKQALIYGGDQSDSRSGAEVVAWSDLPRFDWLRGSRTRSKPVAARRSRR